MLPRPELFVLLVLIGRGVCQDATVTVRLPDDESFRTHTFVYLSINELPWIDSVSSTVQPSDFDVDKSVNPHRIVFRASLPSDSYQLGVTGGSRTHRLILNVLRLDISSIDSAVFLTGPSDSITNALTTLAASIRVISISSNGSSAEAAVQVMRPGTANVPMPLWEAANWMRTQPAVRGLQLMPDRCPETSGQLCRCRLAFTAGRPSVTDAAVRLGRSDNFIGFNLSWVPQTADEMHREACGRGTCLNGGSCDANFTGVGFRCKCPPEPNTPWGPRCEYPVRSFAHTTGEPLSYSRHWIGDLPRSPNAFELSFEFLGSSQVENAETIALRNQNDPDVSLLTVSIVRGRNKMAISGSLLNGNNITFEIAQLSGASWFILHILVQRDKILAVACPRSLPTLPGQVNQPLECYNSTQDISATFTSRNFSNFWLELGRGLQGCVQSVSVNGYALDLLAADVVNGARVGTTCGLQNSTCGRKPESLQDFSCGPESVCYGTLKVDQHADLDCSCRCLGSKRKIVETVTGSMWCRTKNGERLTNVCNKDPWIIRTNSGAESSWSMNNNGPLSLPLKTTATLEMELRTRQGSVESALRGHANMEGSPQVQMEIRVVNGTLRLCIDSASCLQFPPIRVDDGEWHSMTAAIKQILVRLTVDGVSSMHDRPAIRGFMSMALTSRIPSSSLRNIRVSGIYMSTTVNGTDNSIDNDAFVLPRLAADAIVGPEGVADPWPTCRTDTCPANEVCASQWGRTVCECRAGQERVSGGACAAVDPCSKFSVRCPSGGVCRAADGGGGPGFQCVCPNGVTSRLCLTRDPTPEPSTAGLDWRIWLIIVIAIVLVLALTLLSEFQGCG